MFSKLEAIIASAVSSAIVLAGANFGTLGYTQPSAIQTISAFIHPVGAIEAVNHTECPDMGPSELTGN